MISILLLLVAAPPLVQSQALVPVGIADLRSPTARKALDRRIGRTIAMLCGEASHHDLAARNDVRACRHRARTDANRQLRRRAEIFAAPGLDGSRGGH